MDELLTEFLTETNESLEVIDNELVTLEKNPDSPDILDNIFRLVHTIKGTCGFLGLPRLESVAHSGENVLGKVRDGILPISGDIVTIVLEALDRLKLIMAELEATEAEPEGDDQELIHRLDAVAAGVSLDGGAEAAAEPEPEPEPEPELELEPEAVASAVEVPTGGFDEALGRELKDGEVALDELERIFQETEVGAPAAAEAAAEPVAEEAAVAEAEPEPETSAAEAALAAADAEPAAPAAAPAKSDKKEAAAAGATGTKGPVEKSAASQSIRVSVDVLENLMNMVSELVLTRNQLLQLARNQVDSEFTVPLQGLSHVTSELQEGVMKTRMQPIGNAWAKLPRIVRDLAHELDKKIDLEMLGADTELDRQVLELIKDPLTHMVRNSADHGLEMPAERLAANKPEIGKVVLNAYHEGGHIIIEIKDDGAGIDVNRVKEKALENGLTTEAELEDMTDQQALRFVFRAGFSTAKVVTSVSGRGVGMDVVRTNIEKIGGTVDVKSEMGKGSTFTIKIPLTLAIVSALIVECAGERFAIPQISVLELVRASDDSEHRIEEIHGTPVLRLRNRLLPLLQLRDILGLGGASSGLLAEAVTETVVEAAEETVEDAGEEVAAAQADGAIEDAAEAAGGAVNQEAFIVVAQVGIYRFGIVVDRVFDTEEIVVKPVAPLLRHVKEFSGNTILGDGSVIMILDPNGLAEAGGETGVSEVEEYEEATVGTGTWGEEQVALLVFRAGDDEPKAVPLSLVARLEEVDVETIEYSNDRMVVQYRGHLMPLVKISAEVEIREAGRQPILVFADGERSMGLVVDEIVDIIEDHLKIELSSEREGLVGSAVVNGKATGIVDAAYYLTQAFGDWFKSADVPLGEGAARQRVLLIDDSPFFRNLLTPVLSTAGYAVITAESGDAALMLRDQGEQFDVIISDIEMPGMTGFDFARSVKGGGRWQEVPLIALSSHTTPADQDKGREAGFDDYVAKHDRDGLIESLNDIGGVA